MFFAVSRALSSRNTRRRSNLWHPCRRAESNRRDFGFFRVSPPNLAKIDCNHELVKTHVTFDPECLLSPSRQLLPISCSLLPNAETGELKGTLVNTALPPLPSLRRRIIYNSPLPAVIRISACYRIRPRYRADD
jgi:hypothetical protein